MSRRYFGTDGIRGRAGEPPITAEFAARLGSALVEVLGISRPRVAIGRDTRASGPMLEEALARGIISAGGDVHFLGVLPTPGVAAYVLSNGLDAGAVLSASHNPAHDNGIKFFSGDGFKLPDETEAAIERQIDAPAVDRPPGAKHDHLRSRSAQNAGILISLSCSLECTQLMIHRPFESQGRM